MVMKIIIIWANSPVFCNESFYFTCAIMKNMVKCFQKLTYWKVIVQCMNSVFQPQIIAIFVNDDIVTVVHGTYAHH